MASDLPPLHASLQAAISPVLQARTLPRDAHPGLVWERYPKVWRGHDIAEAKERARFLKDFAEEYAAAAPSGQPRLQAMLARLGRLAEQTRDFELLSPLVVGLGNDHPSENGFSFDRAVGVPWLPGSALKGLARAAAGLLDESEDAGRLLGSEITNGGPTRPGSVVFVGAWPVSWPRLRVELINPHHMAYQDDQRHPPAKRSRVATYVEEPNPVTFLAVEPRVRFRVHLRAGRRSREGDLATVLGWVTVGLDLLGAGGKTGSGFGRMRGAS